MPRPRNSVPTYLRHASGRARVSWTDLTGKRQFRMLPGLFNSRESKAAYRTFLAELDAAPHRTMVAAPSTVTVNMVLLAYLDHADDYYRGPDGKPTEEPRHVRTVCRIVRELYGDKPAVDFGPLALKAVRQRFIRRGWCRKSVNRQTDRVRQMFKWAVAEQLVPVSVHQALATVSGLRKGRSAARESEPVSPVDDAIIDATLPYLNRHVRGLVEFQRLTGCRPGEAMSIRQADIEMNGEVWSYHPVYHKTAHKGKTRNIPVGPRAQALLRAYFTPNIGDYLFSPQRSEMERLAERSTNRKTPRYPSHMKRNNTKRVGARRKRPPAIRYNRISYLTAVTRACDRAFPPPGDLAKRSGESVANWLARLSPEQHNELNAWRLDHRWYPYQLRHTFATEVRKEHGLEAAQVLLGHARADVTQVYAERNERLAVDVARSIG